MPSSAYPRLMILTKTKPQPRQIETSAGRADALCEVDLLAYKKLGMIFSQKCSGDVILKSYDFARLLRGVGSELSADSTRRLSETAYQFCYAAQTRSSSAKRTGSVQHGF